MSVEAAYKDSGITVGGAEIRLEGVGKEYETNDEPVRALTSTSMTINPGEFVVLLGPSGCGKTTLLRMIAGLLAPTEGTIAINGNERGGTQNGDESSLGMVFQQPNLLPWRTVLNNVALPLEKEKVPKRERHKIARDLIRLVGIEAFEDRLPDELSGGMQQRVAIARALSTNPQIMLMDEPFGALDAFTRDRMNLELQDIWLQTGQTIVLVTHSITEAVFLADRVALLSARPGRVIDVARVQDARPRALDVQAAKGFQERVLTFRKQLEEQQ